MKREAIPCWYFGRLIPRPPLNVLEEWEVVTATEKLGGGGLQINMVYQERIRMGG